MADMTPITEKEYCGHVPAYMKWSAASGTTTFQLMPLRVLAVANTKKGACIHRVNDSLLALSYPTQSGSLFHNPIQVGSNGKEYLSGILDLLRTGDVHGVSPKVSAYLPATVDVSSKKEVGFDTSRIISPAQGKHRRYLRKCSEAVEVLPWSKDIVDDCQRINDQWYREQRAAKGRFGFLVGRDRIKYLVNNWPVVSESLAVTKPVFVAIRFQGEIIAFTISGMLNNVCWANYIRRFIPIKHPALHHLDWFLFQKSAEPFANILSENDGTAEKKLLEHKMNMGGVNGAFDTVVCKTAS